MLDGEVELLLYDTLKCNVEKFQEKIDWAPSTKTFQQKDASLAPAKKDRNAVADVSVHKNLSFSCFHPYRQTGVFNLGVRLPSRHTPFACEQEKRDKKKKNIFNFRFSRCLNSISIHASDM